MFKNILFFTLFVSITVVGIWSLSRTDGKPPGKTTATTATAQQTRSDSKIERPAPTINQINGTKTQLLANKAIAKNDQSWVDRIAQEIQRDLDNGRWSAAVNRINDIYSKASPEDLAKFKAIILQTAETLIEDKAETSASSLLMAYAETFDDADAWKRLGTLSTITRQWSAAVDSWLRLSALQVIPDEYQTTLKLLTQASSHVRAGLESRGDELGILALYQRIYDQHPNYPRFQLELAQSHLRLDDPIAARPYLDTLQYDPELGTLAKQKLASIDTRLNATSQALETEPAKSASRGQIVVPLFRSGNSYLVDVSINTRPTRLLLDTGASITSLSSDMIQRLGLKPTGRSIKLSTANGLTDAQLYYANSIKLGRLRLTNVTVAKVEFGQHSRLQGLLGTDVLNQMKDRFSYVIDNQQNALIFRAK